MEDTSPLPNTRVYRMFEGYMLRPDRDGVGSRFSRIAFRLPNVQAVARQAERVSDVPTVQIAISDSLPFSPFDEVITSSCVDDAASGCQQVWFVRIVAGSVFLDRLSLNRSLGADADQSLERTTYQLGATSVRFIAGEVLLPSGNRALLLAGTTQESVVISAFDTSSGTIAGTWTLTGSQSGTLVGSWTLTQDFDIWLFVTVRKASSLSTVALNVRSLSGTPIPPEDIHYLPVVPIAQGSDVNGTLGRMLPATSAQQLFLAATDPTGGAFIVMQGFESAKPAQIATCSVDTSFAKPRSPQYRLTCADLDNNGQEELVIAYSTDYGGVSGAGAFVLIRYESVLKKLEVTSSYVATAPNGTPLASKDLRLGSGILGDAVTSGVLVLGAGGDFSHIMKGELQIFAGIVPVNPVTLRFPPYTEVPATLPAVTQIDVTGLKAAGILGSVADLIGLSVTLGAPVFTQLSSREQLLAILQVPPFDRDAAAIRPTLSFSQSDTRVKGLSVSSSKDWMTSVDSGIALGIDNSTLNFQANNSYGRGFSKMDDNTVSMGVQITRTPTQLDRLVTIAIDYSVWKYPILRRSRGEESGGTMLVIFPGSAIPVQATPIAYDRQFGYRVLYEPGALLTYMNVELDGWDDTKQAELLLFTPVVSLEVTNDLPDQNTYDYSDANQNTIGENYYVASTTSTSAHLLASTTLFSYLPVSFGFNLSKTESYTDNEMEMTSLQRTEALTISVDGGTVTDASLRYTVTPYIYQHAKLGATVVAFKVSNLGPGWRRRYAGSNPMLILPFRSMSNDPMERIFSRSISFEPQPDGTVHIVVEVFNHGFTDAEIVNAKLFLGAPKFKGTDPIIPPVADLIGEVNGRVVALGRQRLRVIWTPTEKPSYVTAVVWGGERPYETAEVAWNIFPENSFSSLELPGVTDE
ncbi:hypothetical protein [Dyella sp. Tek66A03]|uniref:hypothetical protein n=1 Tax=Dyella sp. Tek66A03 TaxID=3458298 RepID=UPI00403E9D31